MDNLNHPLGQTFAILAAVAWAFAVLLFKIGGEKTHPLALNIFKNIVAAIFLVATILVFGNILEITDERFTDILKISSKNFWLLAVSGLLGITLADTLFFYSLNIIGVGLTSIMDCLYSPIVVLFSWLMLSESLTPPQLLGAALIVAAVVIVSAQNGNNGLTRKRFLWGVFLAIACKISMAYGIVLAKPTLEDVTLIWATLIRTFAGTISLGLIILLMPQRKALFKVFKPTSHWKIIVPGAFLGAYLALLFWMAGFKYTDVSVAAVLNQTTTIFSIILATLVLKEAFTKRKFIAVVLAMTGIVLVSLYMAE